ncbi:MAG: hypothetical protein HQL69_02540 [Magnetococcales bacterium]|nr:hypothetical protein [Magnetococcales bacterium]
MESVFRATLAILFLLLSSALFLGVETITHRIREFGEEMKLLGASFLQNSIDLLTSLVHALLPLILQAFFIYIGIRFIFNLARIGKN